MKSTILLTVAFSVVSLVGSARGDQVCWDVKSGPRTGCNHTIGMPQAGCSCCRQYYSPRLYPCNDPGCCCCACFLPCLMTNCGSFNHWAFWAGRWNNFGGCGGVSYCGCAYEKFVPSPDMGFEPVGLERLGEIPNDAVLITGP